MGMHGSSLKDLQTLAESASALGVDIRHRVNEHDVPELESGLAHFKSLKTFKLDLSHHAQLTCGKQVGLGLKQLHKLHELVLKPRRSLLDVGLSN